MTVNGGAFTKILMIMVGSLFMAASIAKDLRIGAAFSTAPGFPAHVTQRLLFFLLGLSAIIEGVRLLFR